MYKIILLVLAIFLVLALLFNLRSEPYLSLQQTDTSHSLNSISFGYLITQFRKDNNLPVYKYDPFLCELTNLRLEDIKSNFSHDGFYTRSSSGHKYGFSLLGENLASNDSILSEEQVFYNWLTSPEHRKNLDAPFTHSCLRTDGVRVVHLFASF